MKGFLHFVLFALISHCAIAQQRKNINPCNLDLKYSPKNFHVVSIKDVRDDTTTVGTIEWPAGKKASYNYKTGLAGTLQAHVAKNLKNDTGTIPIELRFIKFEIEKKKIDKQEQFVLDASFNAYVNGSEIYHYSGNSYVYAKADPTLIADVLTVMFLKTSLPRFDDWLETNKQFIPKSIKVNVIMARTSDDSAILAFDPARPLTPADFMGKPGDRQETTSGIDCGLDYKYQTNNNINFREMTFIIRPYFHKRRSSLSDTTNLAELYFYQVVYDIAALKACELYGIARTTTFSYDNAVREFQEVFSLIDKACNEMQERYARESDYAGNVLKHNEWATKVRKQLSNCACYQ